MNKHETFLCSLIFGSDRCSRSGNLCPSVRPSVHPNHMLFSAYNLLLSKGSGCLRSLLGLSQVLKLSLLTSTFSRSLKYFVLLHSDQLSKFEQRGKQIFSDCAFKVKINEVFSWHYNNLALVLWSIAEFCNE